MDFERLFVLFQFKNSENSCALDYTEINFFKN